MLQGHYAQLFPISHLIEEGKNRKGIRAGLPRLFVYTTVIKITGMHDDSQLRSAYEQSVILVVAAVDPVVAETFDY